MITTSSKQEGHVWTAPLGKGFRRFDAGRASRRLLSDDRPQQRFEVRFSPVKARNGYRAGVERSECFPTTGSFFGELSKMRLYFHPLSSNSRRVTMTAEQLGLNLELIVIDLLKGHHRDPTFLKFNPNGKVPLLEDDGFYLWESHAIMQYLADRCPEQALYPHDAQRRADVNRWLFWSAYHFTPAVGFISRERISKQLVGGTGGPDPAEIQRGESLLTAAAKVLDDHLSGRQWITQEKLTLADLAIAAPLMHTAAAQLPVLEFGNLQEWFRRVQSLDAWRNTERTTIGGRMWCP